MKTDDRPLLAMFLHPRDNVSHYFAIRANFKGENVKTIGSEQEKKLRKAMIRKLR